jgi:hypothetical protein
MSTHGLETERRPDENSTLHRDQQRLRPGAAGETHPHDPLDLAVDALAVYRSDEVVQLRVQPDAREEVSEITDLGSRTASEGG